MEQIIVQVAGKDKAQSLVELLSALSFVRSVEVSERRETKRQLQKTSGDFFAMAGLWANRDVTIESIRKQAWPN